MIKTNICFDCENAIDGCNWSRDFMPVDGWDAEPSLIVYGNHMIESYYIQKCPMFVAG